MVGRRSGGSPDYANLHPPITAAPLSVDTFGDEVIQRFDSTGMFHYCHPRPIEDCLIVSQLIDDPNVVLAGVPRRSSSSNLDAYYTRLIERHLLYIATIAIAGWPKNGAPVVYSSGTEMVFLPRSSNTLHR